MSPWVSALIVTAVLAIGGGYETLALRLRRRWLPSITEFTARSPHRAILIGGPLFAIFGFILGRGGP